MMHDGYDARKDKELKQIQYQKELELQVFT